MTTSQLELPGAPHRPEVSIWKQPRRPRPRHRDRLDPPVWVWHIIAAAQAAFGRR